MRVVKVRLYPNKEQIAALEKNLGCARWFYNELIVISQKKYQRTGKGLNSYSMQSYIGKLRKGKPWLDGTSYQALQYVCLNLGSAYEGFFKKKRGYPKFKKKGRAESFQVAKDIYLDGNRVRVPKVGMVVFRGGLLPDAELKKVVVKRSTTGKYYASLYFPDVRTTKELGPISNILGIDLGLKDTVVTSAGDIVTSPKLLNMSQAVLRQAGKTLMRRRPGSKRRKVAKLALAKAHEKVANQRKDFHHKITSNLVADSENQAFAIEDLNVKGMMQNRKLARSIADAGWYQFKTFLTYKAHAVGKPVLEVGRFYPSSKTCSSCGCVTDSLKLSDREWTCGECGDKHHRDINAALNIALEAARNSARGDNIRPETLVRRAIVYETRNSLGNIPVQQQGKEATHEK
jgi:putative transposase